MPPHDGDYYSAVAPVAVGEVTGREHGAVHAVAEVGSAMT